VEPPQEGPGASGAQRSVLAFLRTRPIAAAAVAAGLMFVAVHGSQRVQTGPRERWPEYVVLGVTLYAAIYFVFSFRYHALAGAQPEFTRMALALAPGVSASGIGALGGPSWAAWSGPAQGGPLVPALVPLVRSGQSSPLDSWNRIVEVDTPAGSARCPTVS